VKTNATPAISSNNLVLKFFLSTDFEGLSTE